MHPKKPIVLDVTFWYILLPYISDAGMSQGDLIRKLRDDGWQGSLEVVGYDDTSDKRRVGNVSRYEFWSGLVSEEDWTTGSPPPFAYLEVSLQVYLYRWDVDSVPNVVGWTFKKAVEAMNSRGFKSKEIMGQTTRDSDRDCIVEKISPKEATLLERGKTVELTVWKYKEDKGELTLFDASGKELLPCPGE